MHPALGVPDVREPELPVQPVRVAREQDPAPEPLQIGVVGGGKVQILSGLSLGDTVVIGDASQPLPTNGGFGGFAGGIVGLTGGGGVRVPGAGIGGGAPPGGAPPGR